MNITSGQPRFRQTDVVILRQIMERVGRTMPPEDFVSVVFEAFQASRERSAGDHMPAAFRACPSFQSFCTALTGAKERLGHEPSILVMGAGDDVMGRDSQYAASVVREVFGPSARITPMDLTTRSIYGEPQQRADLVVTHSLAHFFFDQESLYRFIARHVKQGGGYVMGNEPNRRFWVNPEVQNAYRTMVESERMRRRIRAWLNPLHYLRRIASLMNAPESDMAAFERSVNLYLHKRHDFKGGITIKEMDRIIDPFFPDELPGDHPLGGNGLDWENEIPALLPEFSMEWVASARFLGKQIPQTLRPRWQRLNAEMLAKHPLDGNVFCALWWRTAG
jgi:hypothetical protein